MGGGGEWSERHRCDSVSGDLEELCEEVDVSPGGGGEHRHGEGGVHLGVGSSLVGRHDTHILQVAPNWRLELSVERVEEVVHAGRHPGKGCWVLK